MLHVYQTLKSLSHSVLWLKANVRQDIYLLYVTESIKNFFLICWDPKIWTDLKQRGSQAKSTFFISNIKFVTWVFSFDSSQIRLRYFSNPTSKEFEKVHVQELNQHHHLIRYLYNLELSIRNKFVDKNVSEHNNTTKTDLLSTNKSAMNNHKLELYFLTSRHFVTNQFESQNRKEENALFRYVLAWSIMSSVSFLTTKDLITEVYKEFDHLCSFWSFTASS